MLFKSALVTQVSGSIGGMTGSHNRGGLYFRSRAIPVNPNTPAQLTLRAIFASLVQRWNEFLSVTQRDAWNAYASLVPLPGPLGDPVTVSGQNQYIRSNTPRSQAGVAIIDDAPIEFDLGDTGTFFVDNALAPGNAFDVNFTTTSPWAAQSGGFLFVYVSRPQNQSINYFTGPFRFAGTIVGADPAPTSPQTFTSPFAQGIGQRIWIRVRSTQPDGRLGASLIDGPALTSA